MLFIAQRIASGDVLDADNGRDVTGKTGVDVLAFVRLNLDQSRDALTFVRSRIINGVALRKLPGIDAEENELSNERIAPKLERERTENAILIRRRFHRFLGIRVHSLGG